MFRRLGFRVEGVEFLGLWALGKQLPRLPHRLQVNDPELRSVDIRTFLLNAYLELQGTLHPRLFGAFQEHLEGNRHALRRR